MGATSTMWFPRAFAFEALCNLGTSEAALALLGLLSRGIDITHCLKINSNKATIRPSEHVRRVESCSLLTGLPVDGKRRGHRVGRVVPGSIEPQAVVAATCGNAAVVTQVGYGHAGAALRHIASPELSNGLPVGKGPGQRPVGEGGGSGVIDGD